MERKKQSGYDVSYRENSVTIDPHFCRGWDDSGGCYGTNPNHGYTWAEAVQEVVDHYKRQAEFWAAQKEEDHYPEPDDEGKAA